MIMGNLLVCQLGSYYITEPRHIFLIKNVTLINWQKSIGFITSIIYIWRPYMYIIDCMPYVLVSYNYSKETTSSHTYLREVHWIIQANSRHTIIIKKKRNSVPHNYCLKYFIDMNYGTLC